MAGKFELYTDKAGKFRFRLKAGNGIESVRRNAMDASLDDQTSS